LQVVIQRVLCVEGVIIRLMVRPWSWA